MNRIKYGFFVGAVLLLVNINPLGLKAYKIHTVILDAGHGGHDSGCLGAAAKEKDVALSIALEIGKMIEKNHSDVKVIYTRQDDRFLELHQRASIANKNNADLFISVHLNSARPQAFGTETYTQGLHVTGANLEVSKRENASVLLESDYAENYDGFDPKDPTTHIIFELFQSAYRNQSIKFAEKIEGNFVNHAKRHSRGVKQAGFLVLYRTTMPAVLVEAGFLTNRDEEKFLTSQIGRQRMAESVYNAFAAYKSDVDKGKLD